MRIWALGAVAVALACGATGVDATTIEAQAYVNECMVKTGAPGAYALPATDGIPQVTPATGGTVTGAYLVNDCLLDLYQVQFATARTTPDGQGIVLAHRNATGGIYLANGCGTGSNLLRGGSGYCRKQ